MSIYCLLILLLSNAVSMRREKSILYSRLTIIILLLSSLLGIESMYIPFLEKGLILYGGLFYLSVNTQIFAIFIYLLCAVVIQLTAFYPYKEQKNIFTEFNKIVINNKEVKFKTIAPLGFIGNKVIKEQFRIMEIPLIILFIIIGAIFLISSSDLVSIFLSIELQSYGLYLLASLYRNSESATTSGLTYFLLGGLSSCFILLGTSLLYANSGTTNLEIIYIISSISDIILYTSESYYINFSLIIMSVGFLFKVSAAPFHFWSPDVYDGIPTIITTFVAIIPKISLFIFLLELVHYITGVESEYFWTNTLLISSLLSLIIGTVVGLSQFRIKKLYAYSTISHVGFILLALSINKIESIQAFVFYIMQYSISNLNAFFILLALGYLLINYTTNNLNFINIFEKENSPIQLVSQLKGYYYLNPVLAISLTVTIFSFVGIPPLVGFFAKQMVLSAALDNGYIFLSLVAILTSVISAVYYLNIIKQIFFEKPDYKYNQNKLIPLTLSGYLSISISILTLVILLFILMPQEWLSIANILALVIFNT